MTKLNKRLLELFLSLGLAVILVAAIYTPAIALIDMDSDADPPSIYAYGEHGEVTLQLPQPSNATPPAPAGTPSHPTCLRLVANSYNSESTFGAYSTLFVLLWIPAFNGFVPVAQINNVSNPDLTSFLQSYYNNTSVWNPLMRNIFNLDNKSLSVWREGSIIMANLTTPVTITLPFNLMNGTSYAPWGNQTFILPPLTMMFCPTAPAFPFQEITSLTPSPPLSGYTVNITSWMSPAWVKVDIPMWVKGGWLECTGHICTHIIQIGTPPPTT